MPPRARSPDSARSTSSSSADSTGGQLKTRQPLPRPGHVYVFYPVDLLGGRVSRDKDGGDEEKKVVLYYVTDSNPPEEVTGSDLQKPDTTGLLDSAKLSRLIGIQGITLNQWIWKGWVVPAIRGGRGRGKSSYFTLPQCLGIAVAAQTLRKGRGINVKVLQEVVVAFSSVTERWLRFRFAQGQVYFAGLMRGKPLLSDRRSDKREVNLLRTWEKMVGMVTRSN